MLGKGISRKELEKRLEKTALGEFSKKELQLILDYYLDNKINEDIVELYKEVVEREGEEFLKEIKTFDREKEDEREITTLVSFLSPASLNIDNPLKESPILRTLRIIPSINNIFVIYTGENEKNFRELREYLKFQGKEVTGKRLESDSIEENYEYLQTLAKAGEIDRENTLIDFTFGTKMLGVAFYKIAMERGINLVNWEERYFPYYEVEGAYYQETEKVKRMPFLSKLVVVDEPKVENAKLYRALNEELKNMNFSGAMGYYEALGLKDMKNFCKDLDSIFSVNSLWEFNSEMFYQNLRVVLKKIVAYDVEDERAREVIRKVLLRFLPLVDYKKILLEINSFNIRVEDVDNYIDELEKSDRNIRLKIYYSFVIKVLATKMEKNYFGNPLENAFVRFCIKEISELNKIRVKGENIKDIFDYIFVISDAEKLEQLEKGEEGQKLLEIKNKLETIFDVVEDLIEKEKKPIELNRNILKLLKNNVCIDLLEEEKKIFGQLKDKKCIFTKESNAYGKIKYNRIALPLIKLINGEIDELDDEVLEEIYNDKKPLGKGTLAKNKSEIKHIRDFINKVVRSEMERVGEEPKDLIVFLENKPLKMWINEFFKNVR